MEGSFSQPASSLGKDQPDTRLFHFADPGSLQAFKHIFTSPSSVDAEPKATRSGNARIHGMTHVTRASLAYVATQVVFYLQNCGVTVMLTITAVRFALRYLLHLFSLARTAKRILKRSTLQFWNFSKNPRNRMRLRNC